MMNIDETPSPCKLMNVSASYIFVGIKTKYNLISKTLPRYDGCPQIFKKSQTWVPIIVLF